MSEIAALKINGKEVTRLRYWNAVKQAWGIIYEMILANFFTKDNKYILTADNKVFNCKA